MRIEIFESKLFSGGVADEISATISEILTEKNTCTIALSGGSTPGAVYRTLSLPPRVEEIEWEKLKCFLGDERWVPLTDDASNFRMVKETLFSGLRNKKPKLFSVDTALPHPEQGAAHYSEILTKEVPSSDNGIPQFDIMILGLGEDGHTASLFPGTGAVEITDSLCIATKNPHDGSDRISFTTPLITNAQRIFFLVKGIAKADIVKKIIEGHESMEHYPARLFTQASEKVTWLMDSEAASKIKVR